MMLPKISVIIGILNMKEGLRRALESVIAQQYPLVELIIIDGQSTDGTLEVIAEYSSIIHYWSSEKDQGHIDACNKGLTHATGEYIFLLNADDEIAPGLFHEVATLYQKKPHAQMISCGIKIFQENQVKKTIDDAEKMALNLKNILFGFPLTNARFYHRDLFLKYGNFKANCDDGSYYVSNDREFLTRLILNKVDSEIIPLPFYFYYSHPQSLTFGSKNLIKIHEEHLWLAEKLLLNLNLTHAQSKLIKKWRARETVALTYFLLKAGQYATMFHHIKKGLRNDCLRIINQFLHLLLKKAVSGLTF